MSDFYNLVREFHKHFGHPAPDTIQALTQEQAEFRKKTIESEIVELMEATEKGDIVEQYDAFIDILYFALGGLVIMGAHPHPGFMEAHAANMTKLGTDGLPIRSRGEEIDGEPLGKILKGPNYQAPDMVKALEALGWKPSE